MLYVGITRARKNLWIFDESDKSEPMRVKQIITLIVLSPLIVLQMIWTSRNQIQNRTPGPDVPIFAKPSSTSADWESTGNDLFQHKKYTHAMYCFARASKPRFVAICKAFHLRDVARAKVNVAPLKAQREAFLTAADAFTSSGNDAPPGNDKFQYYRNAAECYMRGGNNQKAAIRYLSAQDYDKAAQCFRKAGLFDKTLEVLHKYSQKIPLDVSEALYDVCRLFYCSKHDGNRYMFRELHMNRCLTDISGLGRVCHCSRRPKKNWNSLKPITSTSHELRCLKIMENIWRRQSFICLRTGHSKQLKTS